ncbi:helix-turn-helix domain-containing protein [Spirosoma koreense]
MLKVPSYEEFEALLKRIDALEREVRYLMGIGGQWLDRKQAMKALNCSSATLHRLMRSGKLAHRYEGSKPLFEADGIRAYIQSTRVSTDSTDNRVLSAIHSKT